MLDTPSDEITRLAGWMLQAPIALITLVDIDRVWFEPRQGWADEAGARDISFCATTDPGTGSGVVPDGTTVPRRARAPG